MSARCSPRPGRSERVTKRSVPGRPGPGSRETAERSDRSSRIDSPVRGGPDETSAGHLPDLDPDVAWHRAAVLAASLLPPVRGSSNQRDGD